MEQHPIWKREGFHEKAIRMLEELISRNEKYKKYKKQTNSFLFLLSLIVIYLALLLFQVIKVPYLDTQIIIFSFFCAFLYIGSGIRQKEQKKKKDKFDKLRAEVIDSADKYWSKKYGDSNINKLVKELKEDYDINISFKS